jgi:hypothetical protein
MRKQQHHPNYITKKKNYNLRRAIHEANPPSPAGGAGVGEGGASSITTSRTSSAAAAAEPAFYNL